MTFFADTHPTARKPHRCELCYRHINVGETYRRNAGMDGATAWTWIECGHCEAFARVAYRRSGDDNYDGSLLIDFEPETIPEARVRAQHRRKWRMRSGDLYPIPAIGWREDRYGFGHPVAIGPGETP